MMKKAGVGILLSSVCFAVIFSFLIISCKGETGNSKQAGNQGFKTVIIGTQEWMAENLNLGTFRNGDPIPEVKTDEEWEKAGDEGQPCWCYYENDEAKGETYGKLYNWYAVNDKRGLAPEGWHVPDINDWSILADFLGGAEIAGGKMKSVGGWNEDGNGSDESGFSGLPGGFRADFGRFYSIGETGAWWSSTRQEEIPDYAFRLSLSYENEMADWVYDNYGTAYSVRCVRD